jgi:hypothetical protein
MKKLRATVLAVMTAFLLASPEVFSQTVSVLAFQAGADKEEKSEEFMTTLVSACMDRLFYSGFIATSEKVSIVGQKEFQSEALERLDAAREGFVAYELLFLVSPKKSAYSKTFRIPDGIEYRFVDCDEGKTLLQGKLKGMPDSQDASEKLDAWCAQAGKMIMDACIKKIPGVTGKVGS